MKKRAAGKATINPTGADAAPEVGSDLNENGELPLFFPALVIEGMSTSDGRNIGAGVLDHRALPISVLAQWTNPGNAGGHAGAEVIGHLDEVWRVPGPQVVSRQSGQPFPEGTYVWQGRGVADPETTGGKLARQGHLRGNSVDLSDVDYDEEFAEDGSASVHITKGTIAATTLCPIPAFADAYVEISGTQDAPGGEPVAVPDDLTALDDEAFERVFDANPPGDDPALAGRLLSEALRRHGVAVTASAMLLTLPPFRAVELGDDCGPCLAEVDEEWTEGPTGQFSPTVAKRRRAYARGLAIKGDKPDGSDASYPIENQGDADKAAMMVGLGKDPNGVIKSHIRKAVRKLGLKTPPSLTAAAGPSLPPMSLFADPHLAGPTPIMIGAPRPDGRRELTGHIASWTECHASYGNRCVRPPHSRTDYARFATGAARALNAEGDVVTMAVGRISMSRSPASGGHAPATLTEADTVAFYDNTCLAVADVAAGEDAHGIWVHGLTRELSEAEVDALLSAPPSGDWRAHNGNLELCAILAVNTPGYVVPRSRVASGEPISLVAAGALRPGREFAPAVPVTEAMIESAVNRALLAFFDPDNDGDIDRPMDPGSTAGQSGGTAPVPPMAERAAAALRSIRREAALGTVVVPFGNTR